MSLKKYIDPFWYAFADYFTASIAWMLFYFYRKSILGQELFTDQKFFLGVVFIPVGWLLLYALVGSYNSVYKKSRLTEFTKTFVCSIIGCIILFFLFLLDDVKNDYNYYYTAFGSLFGLHFMLTTAGRLIVLNMVKRQLVSKKIRFRGAICGHYENALRIYRDAEKRLEVEGFYAAGYISVNEHEKFPVQKFLPRLGHINELEKTNRHLPTGTDRTGH